MSSGNVLGLALAGALMATGIATGGYFISETIYKSKVGINTAEAKGLAERRVTSDRANWDISFKVQGGKGTVMATLYTKYEKHQKIIIDELRKKLALVMTKLALAQRIITAKNLEMTRKKLLILNII